MASRPRQALNRIADLSKKYKLSQLSAAEIERCSAAEAENDQLSRDISAINLLVRSEFDADRIEVSVDRHCAQDRHEVAYLIIYTEPRALRHEVRARAEEAILALGYSINSEQSWNVCSVDEFPEGSLSAHEKMELLRRVRDALNGRTTHD